MSGEHKGLSVAETRLTTQALVLSRKELPQECAYQALERVSQGVTEG